VFSIRSNLWPGLLVLVACLSSFVTRATEKSCSYTTYQWNIYSKKAVNLKRVKHAYSSLSPTEIDSLTGCTVCEEDQRLIKIGTLPPFNVCKILASDIRYHLTKLLKAGEPIYKVVGYRVGMTRGDTDNRGNRIQFSNHSFGIAIDINGEQNGLYDHCMVFGPDCKLRKGGEWDPRNKASLTKNSPVVLGMKSLGLKWGGEIKGHQKDFMHFSPSGY